MRLDGVLLNTQPVPLRFSRSEALSKYSVIIQQYNLRAQSVSIYEKGLQSPEITSHKLDDFHQ